jgi:phosphate transport system substrate-binding protein
MMNYKFLLISLIASILLICVVTIWYTNFEHYDKDEPIIITGSSVIADSVEQACREWQNLTPVAVRVEVADSSNAIRDVNRGGTDIAMLSRPLSWTETTDYPDLILTPIGYDAIALVVSNSNRVLSLSEDQVREIFSGEIKDWEDVGGPNGKPIDVLGREPGSQIRDYFRKTGLKTMIYSKDMKVFQSDDDIITALRGDHNGTMIAYLPLSKIPVDLRIISIKSSSEKVIDPSLKSVSTGDYPYVRPLYLVTMPDARDDVKALVTFISSPFGREILKKNGIIPYEEGRKNATRMSGH